jgi:hypothetical protein
MDRVEIRRQRLFNQRITHPVPQKADEIVHWLGAVQAQDYAGAKWSLGLRIQGASDQDIETAFNQGAILRTHMLRPTWHFVHPEDIRWMLALTGPRVHAVNEHRYGSLELDTGIFKLSQDILLNNLEGGRHLTRKELGEAFREGGIPFPEGQRLAYIMMRAELDGLVCSGPRRGKQFTYALLDDRVPPGRTYDREESLVELARLYFRSRGPARVQDFSKWSGLTVADARQGHEGVKEQLQHEVVRDEEYWFPPFELSQQDKYLKAHLLSIYDEYISSYKGWELIIDHRIDRQLLGRGNALNYIVVVDGLIAGSWNRVIRKDSVNLQTVFLTKLTSSEKDSVARAVGRYGKYLGLTPTLTTS